MIRHCLFFILLLSFTVLANSSISGSSHTTDTLDFFQGIDFSSDTIKGLSGDAQCTSDVDFFIATAEKCCLTMNCHCGIRFGSKNQLYLSREKFNSFDFSKELDLTDSTLFIPAAQSPPDYFTFCSETGSFWIQSDIGELDLTTYEQSFFVVKTSESSYILIRVSHLATYCWEVGQPCVTGYNWIMDSKIKIDWITGKNNKPFFPDLIPSKTLTNTVKKFNTSRMTTRYDLQGKKINEKKNISKSAIIITKNRNGTCQKMLLNSGRK
ncbi:MAG: hypothetical protein JW915_17830 [Chitinispirillaceae bacterium]|nr:hypothetical protein [Chitinispirillaceae bacterium]